MRHNGGCFFDEDPTVPADSARLFWHGSIDPSVIRAVARPCAANESGAFDISTLLFRTTVLKRTDEKEEVLIGTGHNAVRLSISEGTLLHGPVRLAFEIGPIDCLEDHLAAIGRLAQLVAARPLAARFVWPDTHIARRVDVLKTLDALADARSQRSVAEIVFGRDRVATDWMGPSDHMRSRVRRLIRKSNAVASHAHRMQITPLPLKRGAP